ncbi:MAG: carboxypeptidase regulatory-like domain-containing protein, partial [Terriglobia bacterium]
MKHIDCDYPEGCHRQLLKHRDNGPSVNHGQPGTGIRRAQELCAPRSPERRRPIAHLFRYGWGLLVMWSLLLGAPAWGQQQGTISGTITDNTGGMIPGVTIQVTNVSTQVTRTTSTNSAGYYISENLIPGEYVVSAQKQGFKKATRSSFTLQVAQSATVNFTLEVGAVTQTVSVRATPPLLQTTNSTIGQVVGPQETSQLPLNDRNYLNLALLSPGTSSYFGRTFYNSALTDNSGSINSGSAGEDRNSFSLDGADIKSYLINGSFVPSIDAIQEFKIETTPYSAALGTSPGAQVLLVTKSGTNQFHGEAYDFLRNSSFDARNFFDNPSLPIPELRKNQFGGTAGGPIIKDKLFFFADYEGFRERIGETFFGTVPTVQMRNGDFSQLQQQQIFNPFTTQPCPSCASGEARDPFPDNIVPQSLLSPVSLAYMQSQFPLPTSSGVVNGTFVGGNFAGSAVDRTTRNQFNTRIDYTRPKDSIFGRFSFNNSTLYAAKATFNSGQLPGFGDNDVINTRDAVLADTHTFGPTTILEGEVTFFRQFFNLLPQQLGNDLNQKLGIQGVLPDVPFISGIAGFSNPGSNPFDPEFRAVNQYGYIVRLTKVLGRHTFNLGGEYDRWQVMINAAPSFPQGQFGFDGSFTKNPNAPSSVITGYPFADFLLGYPVSALTQSGDSGGYMLRNNFRWWFNDELRATPNLTLNLGMRWEYDGPFYEKFNRLSNFDPATGKLIVAGQDFISRSAGVRPDLDNFAPRFGFAYAIPGHR